MTDSRHGGMMFEPIADVGRIAEGQRRTKLSALIDAAKPFARIAFWQKLTDKNTDGLPCPLTVIFPQGRTKYDLTGKDFRLLGEAFEDACKQADAVDECQVRMGEYDLLANRLKTARDGEETQRLLIENLYVVQAALFVAGRAISASRTNAETTKDVYERVYGEK